MTEPKKIRTFQATGFISVEVGTEFVLRQDYLKLQAQCEMLAEALNDVQPYLESSYDLDIVQTVYIPPVQAMRNAADKLEKKDLIIAKARQTLQEYNKFKEEVGT